MKKIWMLGIIFAVVGSLGLAGAVALGDATPVGISVVETGSGQAHVAGLPGDEITMSVPLDNAAAAAGVQFNLNYPPAMLEVTSLSAGNAPAGYFYTNPDGPTGNFPSNSGLVRAVWANASASGVSDYVMFNVTFRLIGQPGDVAALTFDEVIIGDAGTPPGLPGRLDHVQNDGSITIQSADQVELLAIDPVTGSSTIVGQIGGQVIVRYVARNAGSMAGFQFINRFDNSVVHIPGNAAVDFSVSNFPTELFAGVRNDEGELSIAAASNDGTGIDEVIIADVTYDLSAAPVPVANSATGDPLCTPLVFDNVTIGDGVPSPLPFTTINGQICLEEATGVDLAITKSGDPDPVVAGENLTYTLVVTNVGSEPATGVTILDNLPAGPTGFVSASTGCNYDIGAHGVTCAVGDLGPGQSATVEIIVDVVSAVEHGTVITNTASVSSNENELVPGDNTVSEDTDVVRSADVTVSKTGAPNPVTQGGTLTYTIDVTNNGPSDASGVVLVDTLPAGLEYVSHTAPAGVTCTVTGTVTCTKANTAAGASDTMTITVEVVADAGSTLTNTATVDANENDPNTGNNTAAEDTTVVAAADLSIVKTDSTNLVDAGSNLTYTLTVTNNGPSDATGVTIVDNLPDEVSFVSAAGCDYDAVGGSVTCDIGSLALLASNAVVITVAVGLGANDGTISNTATVTGNESDPDGSNNSATEETTIEAFDGPVLSIPDNVLGVLNSTVMVPVNFTGNSKDVTATTFSVDFDEQCLTYDSHAFFLPAGFSPSASFDGNDTDGELDFGIFQFSGSPSPIPDGKIAEISFTVICDPAPAISRLATVDFSVSPIATFSDAQGQDVPGATSDGSVLILGGIRGDCNGDGPLRLANGQEPVTAADIQALINEIFDDDGELPIDTPGGTYAGNPIGCDANADSLVRASDLQCIINIIFTGTCDGSGVALKLHNSEQRSNTAGEIAVASIIPNRVEGGVFREINEYRRRLLG